MNSVAFPKPIFGSLHLVSDMSSCYWNSIIIAEKVLNSKPVRSISYAEYLRNRDTPSAIGSSSTIDQYENQSALDEWAPEASTVQIPNRFANFNPGSPPISQINNNSFTASETPEWLKKDIENMDFIPMDALQFDNNLNKKEKASEINTIDSIDCNNNNDNKEILHDMAKNDTTKDSETYEV